MKQINRKKIKSLNPREISISPVHFALKSFPTIKMTKNPDLVP